MYNLGATEPLIHPVLAPTAMTTVAPSGIPLIHPVLPTEGVVAREPTVFPTIDDGVVQYPEGWWELPGHEPILVAGPELEDVLTGGKTTLEAGAPGGALGILLLLGLAGALLMGGGGRV